MCTWNNRNTQVARKSIQNAASNGKTIGRKIFNGIFAFEEQDIKYNNGTLANILTNGAGLVNNICFGKDMFIKYWDAGMPVQNPRKQSSYAIYQIDDLAFGYFISNLVEDIYISMNGKQIPNTLRKMFYPIENTKEAHRVRTIEVQEMLAHGEF